MQALRIQRRLDSETIPELKPWIGRTVEITIVEQATGQAATEREWQEFFATAGLDLADPELLRQHREFDRQSNSAPQL